LVAISIVAALAIYFTASFSYNYPVAYALFGVGALITFSDIIRFIYQYIQEKQPETPAEAPLPKPANEDIPQCPDALQPFYALVPKNFANSILHSPSYTQREKLVVFTAAPWVYCDNPKPPDSEFVIVCPTGGVDARVTMHYLNGLSVSHPYFTTFSGTACAPSFVEQLDFAYIKQEKILNALPNHLNTSNRYLFGHALRIDGIHRTAFLIDLRGGTVEYWNSLGCDKTVSDFFINLAEELTKKFRKKFDYIHHTQGTCWQQDGYQCGIWTCKFLEERILQAEAIGNGGIFSFKNCQSPKFDITAYREQVFASAYAFRVFLDIGEIRATPLTPYLVRDFYHLGKTGTIPDA
jgi:hypothetical protein